MTIIGDGLDPNVKDRDGAKMIAARLAGLFKRSERFSRTVGGVSTMRKNEVFPSKYMKAEDLLDDSGNPMVKVFTIKDVVEIEYPDSKTGRALEFEQSSKQLGLNVTNWDAVCEISGKDDDSNWSGVSVELFRTRVEFRGKNVPAIRIRPVGGWENEGAQPKEENPKAEVPF